MPHDWIDIRGARVHNLRDVDVRIPRNRLVVVTGLSGSGKSSLAFDTLYAEGQRRYVESLSAYARQFLEQVEKPDVDQIDGLSPAISIEQRTTGSNPRSTVGTVTEIYDYLRLLFANIGVPHCPSCGREITSQSVERIVETIMTEPEVERVNVLAPIVRGRKGEFKKGAGRHPGTRTDARSDRWRGVRRRRRTPAGSAAEPLDRSRSGPARRASRRRAASHRVHRVRAEPGGRRRGRQHAGRRRSAVLAAHGLRRLRDQRSRDDAAGLLLQLAARRMSRLPRAGRRGGLRSRADRARRFPHPVRRGHRGLGRR